MTTLKKRAPLQDPSQAGDPALDPIPITQTPDNPDYYNQQLGHELPTSYWDSMRAALKLSFENLPDQYVGQYVGNKVVEAEGRKKLTAAEANEMYHPDVPFSGPVDPIVAQVIGDNQREKARLESIIARGPNGPFSKLSRFVGDMAVQVASPINWLSMGLAGAAVRAIPAARSALTVTEGMSAARAFGVYTAEAAIGGAAVEPFHALGALQNQEDYRVTDSLKNIGVFSLGFGGLHVGVRYGLPKVRALLERSPETARAAEETALGQMAEGKRVNVSPIIDQVIREKTSVAEAPSGSRSAVEPYAYRPLDASEAKGKVLYAGNALPIGEDVGHGLYMTDNPGIANNHALDSGSPAQGNMRQVSLGDVKLIDTDLPPVGDVKVALDPILKSVDGNSQFAETVPLRETLERIREAIRDGRLPESALENLNQRFLEKGFDGYRIDGSRFMGKEGAAHNVVMLFDPAEQGLPSAKTTEQAKFRPAPELVPGVPGEVRTQMVNDRFDPKTDMLFDERAHEEFQRLMAEPPKLLEVPELDSKLKAAQDELKGLVEQGLAPESALQELEATTEMAAKARNEELAIKSALFCLGRNI